MQKRIRENEISLNIVPQIEIASYEEEQFKQIVKFNGEDFAIESELLYDALDFLTEDHYRIIMLYYFFGMTDKKISKLSGLKRTAVRNRRHRALSVLKKALGGKNEGL